MSSEAERKLRGLNRIDGRPVKPCRRCGAPDSVFADIQGARLCVGCKRPAHGKLITLEAALNGRTLLEELTAMERCGEPMTSEQIAVVLGMTRSRAYQVELQALRKFARNWRIMFGSDPFLG